VRFPREYTDDEVVTVGAAMEKAVAGIDVRVKVVVTMPSGPIVGVLAVVVNSFIMFSSPNNAPPIFFFTWSQSEGSMIGGSALQEATPKCRTARETSRLSCP